MKRVCVGLVIFFCCSTSLWSAPSERLYLSGTGTDDTVDWEFNVTAGRGAGDWTTIPVPSNWELQGFGTYNYGHDRPKADEQGLYKYSFSLPPHWADKRIFIVFEGAMTDTKVEINGKLAGPVHQGGFYRFEYEITELLNFEAENLLKANVSKMSANESVNQAERQADYWVFGGIYRPVYLKAVPKEFIDWTAIDAQADGSFRMNVHLGFVEKANRLQAQIVGLDGQAVSASFSTTINADLSMATLQTRVSDVLPWSAESPNLYYVDVVLMENDTPVHSVRERFGFRTFQVREGEGLYLNGKPIVLKGCNRHSFWPTTGRALNRNRCLKDILTLKAMNMNAVRMSHYPPDTWFLELCDELGMYVLDELAGWQKPPYDTEIGERLVKQIVKRDVNHPSILFWDNGNEGGWNTELDDEFGKWDPQNRRVLHPWELHGGVDTDHYENYQSTVEKLQSGNIFMPTEYLHGLYDGGHGAGLEDYWQAMWGNPLTGGMFLWVFADEGVVRTDLNGKIDTDGNHAPDGILGPFHEREASFYTIKELWSPVYIDSEWQLPEQFDGQIPVENRYDFDNLNTCTFEWKLVHDYGPSDAQAGHAEWVRESFPGPDIPARDKGFVSLELPANWQNADALVLTAIDKNDRELFTWKWRITSQADVISKMVNTRGQPPRVASDELAVSAGLFTFTFDETTGQLSRVQNGAHVIPFENGPRFVASNAEPAQKNPRLRLSRNEGAVNLSVTGHPDFETLEWTVHGSGWLQLDYQYSHEGPVDVMGVSFEFPESHVNEVKWLGKGPYRVWKNRLKGGTVDVWHEPYKNFQRNTAWNYPVSPGYFADFHWVVLYTDAGPITIATPTEDLFLRLFFQKDGDDPRHTKMIWPSGDISFVHAIPAIGTKFKQAEEYGPMSQPFQASGSYQGTLYFYFGLPTP